MNEGDAIIEAQRILIEKHRDEFEGIYNRVKREIKRHGGILE